MHLYCFIMRGIPGSGKSSVARLLASSMRPGGEFSVEDGVTYYTHDGDILAAIHSTDEYFMVDGEYRFNPMRLGTYHSLNFKAFKTSCELEIPIVICDNTNTTRKEWKRYAACGDNRGYLVSQVAMPLISVEESVARNKHGVPAEAIERMINRWEPWNGKF